MNRKIFGVRIGTIITALLAVLAAVIVWVVAKSTPVQELIAVLPSWN